MKKMKTLSVWDCISPYVWLFISIIGAIANFFPAAYGMKYNASMVIIVVSFIFLLSFVAFFVAWTDFKIRAYFNPTQPSYFNRVFKVLQFRKFFMKKRNLYQLTRFLKLFIEIFFAILLPGLFMLLILSIVKFYVFWILFAILVVILFIDIGFFYGLCKYGKKHRDWYHPVPTDLVNK